MIMMEQRGVPAAAICTHALRASADAMARLQGISGYRYAVVTHPVASLVEDEIQERARVAAPQVLEILRGERREDAAR
jgi:hypothetical protein